jgi:predicted DNA-binding ribbon-helix-helix protein
LAGRNLLAITPNNCSRQFSLTLEDLMLKRYLEQRHIDLDSGRSCLALEREYWQALEVLAYEDGWNNWRDFFYMRVLPDKPEDISLASHVRKMVTVFLFDEFDERRSRRGISRSAD